MRTGPLEADTDLPVPDKLYRNSLSFSPGWLRRYLDVLAARERQTMNVSPLVPAG
jgi:hypothetical protein